MIVKLNLDVVLNVILVVGFEFQFLIKLVDKYQARFTENYDN